MTPTEPSTIDVSPSHYQTNLTSTPPSASRCFFHGNEHQTHTNVAEIEKREDESDYDDEVTDCQIHLHSWEWNPLTPSECMYGFFFLNAVEKLKWDISHLSFIYHASSIVIRSVSLLLFPNRGQVDRLEQLPVVTGREADPIYLH